MWCSWPPRSLRGAFTASGVSPISDPYLSISLGEAKRLRFRDQGCLWRLSHDHHGDNLDPAGRVLLPSAGVVVTGSGAKRLGGGARGLEPWATTRLEASGRPPIEITATPCRHGPPLSHPIIGDVIGFTLRWDGQEHGVLWISRDTVLYDGVREVVDRLQVGTALLHLGGVRFPVTGPVRYTMTGRDAVELCRLISPHTAIPIHYEGWKHFRQGREAIEREFDRAPEAFADASGGCPSASRSSSPREPVGQAALARPTRPPRSPHRGGGPLLRVPLVTSTFTGIVSLVIYWPT